MSFWLDHIELLALIVVVVTLAWMRPGGRVSGWRFWDPRSGLRGGSIAGAAVALAIIVLFCE